MFCILSDCIAVCPAAFTFFALCFFDCNRQTFHFAGRLCNRLLMQLDLADDEDLCQHLFI